MDENDATLPQLAKFIAGLNLRSACHTFASKTYNLNPLPRPPIFPVGPSNNIQTIKQLQKLKPVTKAILSLLVERREGGQERLEKRYEKEMDEGHSDPSKHHTQINKRTQ